MEDLLPLAIKNSRPYSCLPGPESASKIINMGPSDFIDATLTLC